MADYIPLAIQAEIMKRLPIKSLMQFRSVSKPWKSVIDSSNFISDCSFNHTHQHRLLVCYTVSKNSEQKYVSFVDDDTFPHKKLSFPVPIPVPRLPTILGSSHGVFFLYSMSPNPNEPGKKIKMAAFWNPSVRKSVEIDVPDVVKLGDHFLIGFGVCPHSRDPKVVKIIYNDSLFNHSLLNADTITFAPWKVEVYTLSSGVWRSIPNINQPRNTVKLVWNQVVTDGFIYWLAIDGIRISTFALDFKGCNMIVSFDLTNEKFMEVTLPDSLTRANNNNVVISKLKECLVAVEVVKEGEKEVYDVWMMERGVSNMFTKFFTVNSPDASIQGIRGFRSNGEPIFEMSSTNDSDEDDRVVHEVNLEDMNYVGIFANELSFYAHSYMETLLLLDH